MYLPDYEEWYKANYSFLKDQQFIIEIYHTEGQVDIIGQYEFRGKQLLLIEGTDEILLSKADFVVPSENNSYTSKKAKSEEDSKTYLGQSLEVSDYKTYDLVIDGGTLNLDYLYLGRNATLNLSESQYVLFLKVKNFVAKSGSKIIGKGKDGHSIEIQVNNETKISRMISTTSLSSNNCVDGLHGRNGTMGGNGSGCDLTITCEKINVESLTIDLRVE